MILSPFVSKSELIGLFSGKNLFADPELIGTFEQLLGIDGYKPLECVGEIAEARKAIAMAQASGNYPELFQFEFPEPEYDIMEWHNNYLPKDIEIELKKYLHKQ